MLPNHEKTPQALDGDAGCQYQALWQEDNANSITKLAVEVNETEAENHTSVPDLPIPETPAAEPNATNLTNNETFLSEIFGGIPEGVHPVVVSVKGNPIDAPESAWFGRAWQTGEALSRNMNNYFSLSVFSPERNGSTRRRKQSFRGWYAIMLDDLGTKVDVEKITLLPSWRLETSAGNYQFGYILKSPIIDPKEADQLMKAIINAELCDAGAGGPTARLARLPVGINGKLNPAFSCQMREWHPERRYSKDEIVEAFQLDLNAATKRTKTAKKVTGRATQERDEIFLPAPTDNPVITTLKARKLYKCELGDGKHDMTCPWCSEHTDAADNGTAYFEPDANYPLGGFRCLHGHCEGRTIRTLLDFLGVPVSAARMKPSIRVMPGQLHQIVPYAEKVLADTGEFFHNGMGVVKLVKEPMTGEMCMRPMVAQALPPALSAASSWERFDRRGKDVTAIDPPEKVSMALAAAVEYKYLPYLLAVVHQPYMRLNGDLVWTPGYDRESCLYGVFDASRFSVSEIPTHEEAQAALGRLRALLEDFPFATAHDEAAALSGMLTAVLRPVLPLAPMFHVQASQVGSGKSYLCSLIASLASGKNRSTTNLPGEKEECQKVLLSELMSGTPVIVFDNLTGDIFPHESLASVLTEEHVSWRILGFSKKAKVSTRVLFLSSGNNVVPVRDMTRRCVTITLNPQCENPVTRMFKRPNLLKEVNETRITHVCDALTIVRAWICSGRPLTACRPVASYMEWSELCRQPLLWLGLPDPAQPLFDAMEYDPDKENLSRLLENWWVLFRSNPTMARKLALTTKGLVCDLEASEEERDANTELGELIDEVAGDGRGNIDPRRLGKWLVRHQNRIVGDKQLVRADGKRAAAAFQVKLVK